MPDAECETMNGSECQVQLMLIPQATHSSWNVAYIGSGLPFMDSATSYFGATAMDGNLRPYPLKKAQVLAVHCRYIGLLWQ